MKSAGVPKSFVIFIVLTGAFLALLFTLFIPTFKKMPEYNTKHTQVTTDIAEFEKVLANQPSVEAKIEELQNTYNTTQSELYIDANSSIEDLQAIFQELGITMTTLSRGEGVQDTMGRASKGGFPLYTTSLNFTFDSDINTTQRLIHYLEQESKGCYFIDQLSLSPLENNADRFTVNFNVTLFYFDSTVLPTQPATTATEAKK